jgi:hypothetical protein
MPYVSQPKRVADFTTANHRIEPGQSRPGQDSNEFAHGLAYT